MERREPSDRRRAFEAEALPHLDRLWAAARRLAHQDADAEDLVQETFLRAYRTFHNFVPGTNSRAWLLTILHSVFVNHYHRRRHEPESRPAEELEKEGAAHPVRRGLGTPVAAGGSRGCQGPQQDGRLGIECPAEVYRAAVLLVDLEELTYEEAAAALGCPVGTLRSRLARARRLLAAALADYARALGVGGGPRP